MKRSTKKTAARKPVAAAKPKRDISENLATACQALVELYPTDRTKPGLVLAWIPDKKQFYASFVRYEGATKNVIANAYGATLPEAFEAVIAAWKSGTRSARRMLCMSRPDDFVYWEDQL